MKTVQFRIEGTLPLLMNSDEGVNPMSAISREIKKVTDKKSKKTEAEAELVHRLCWQRAMYYDAKIGPYVPAWNLLRCIQDAAKLRRQGKSIERGLILSAEKFALQYDGPRTFDAMFEAGYVDVRSVGQNGKRILRARPRFDQWALDAEFFLDESMLNEPDLMDAVEAAGRFVGLGDYRARYGKFEVVK